MKKGKYKHSKKIREKISKGLKGNKNSLGTKHSKETKLRIRKANLGKKLSEKHRKKISKALKGEKSYLWKGGISSKGRKSLENRLWRETVFTRDNWTCQKCEVHGGELHAHHIRNFAQCKSLRLAIDNGITFCKKCHRKFHRIYGTKNNNIKQVKEFLNNKLLHGTSSSYLEPKAHHLITTRHIN